MPSLFYSTLNVISADISILGSSAMLYVISKSRDKLKTTLHRLLFYLCWCTSTILGGDIIVSFAFLFQKPFLWSQRIGRDQIVSWCTLSRLRPIRQRTMSKDSSLCWGVVSYLHFFTITVFVYTTRNYYAWSGSTTQTQKSSRRSNHIFTQFLGRGRRSVQSMHEPAPANIILIPVRLLDQTNLLSLIAYQMNSSAKEGVMCCFFAGCV